MGNETSKDISPESNRWIFRMMLRKKNREPEPIDQKLINKYADQWCKDNGYPLLKRKYIYKGNWKLVDIER